MVLGTFLCQIMNPHTQKPIQCTHNTSLMYNFMKSSYFRSYELFPMGKVEIIQNCRNTSTSEYHNSETVGNFLTKFSGFVPQNVYCKIESFSNRYKNLDILPKSGSGPSVYLRVQADNTYIQFSLRIDPISLQYIPLTLDRLHE